MGKDDLYFVLGAVAVWIVIFSVINIWAYIQKNHMVEGLLIERKDLEVANEKLKTENYRLKNDLNFCKLSNEISEGVSRSKVANRKLEQFYRAPKDEYVEELGL